MKRRRMVSTFKFLLFVLCITVIVYGGYLVAKRELTPIGDFLNEISDDNKKNIDNYNGIYEDRDDLNGSKAVFNGCNISYMSNYILVIDDYYYVYRSSCMGTYLKSNGMTKDLEIKESEEDKTYTINYNGVQFKKNSAVFSIVPNNRIEDNLYKINLNTYQLFIKETQFEGNYYDIDAQINNISSDLRFVMRYLQNGTFNMSINYRADVIYNFVVNNYDYLPDLFPYGRNVVVIEKNKSIGNNVKYHYNFKVLDEKGIIYNLYDYFPIIVDGVTLNQNNSIFITFDSTQRVFKMLIGFDDKMCSTDDKSDEIAYYEFEIDYSYSTNKFDKPLFIKKGKKSEGCAYVDKIMGR